jgi:hypothetical protein
VFLRSLLGQIEIPFFKNIFSLFKYQEVFKLFTNAHLVFSIFCMFGNDRGYGHPAVCGSFTVALRQSECGRKTCGMHVSQQVNIGVCVRPAWAVRTCCKASEKLQKYKYFWLNNAFSRCIFSRG